MNNLINSFKKLLNRKNKKYYNSTDLLTKKEKRQLTIVSIIILVPLFIAFFTFIFST